MYLKLKEKAVLIGADALCVTPYFRSSDEEVPAINSSEFCLLVGAEPVAVSPSKDVLVDLMGWILFEWSQKPNGLLSVYSCPFLINSEIKFL